MPRIIRFKIDQLSKWKFILMMIIMVFSWALAFHFIKIGLNELTPVNLTIMRFFIVCIVLILLLLLQPNKFSKLQKKDTPTIFILGFFGVMVYHLGLNYGEQNISPSAASLIIATIPIFIIILAIIFLKEKIVAKKILGIIISISGVILISLWGRPDAFLEIKYVAGAFTVLIAAIMGAFYTVAGKKMLSHYSALSLTVYAMLLGSLGLLPFVNISIIDQVVNMSSASWIAVIFLGTCSTVVGYTIWYVALQIKTASELSVYLYCIPVLTIFIDILFFNEKITSSFILGGIMVIIGLIIASEKRAMEKIKF